MVLGLGEEWVNSSWSGERGGSTVLGPRWTDTSLNRIRDE